MAGVETMSAVALVSESVVDKDANWVSEVGTGMVIVRWIWGDEIL